jgi:hypothetical protein
VFLLLGSTVLAQDLSYRVRTEILDQRNPVTVNVSTSGCFKMGTDELPPMLLDHAVTVVLAKSVVCAIVNHSTGVQRCYRPRGVYKRNNGGWLFLVLALGILAAMESQGHRAAVAGLRGIMLVVWIGFVGLEQLRVLGYNARLDRSLQTLIALDSPLRGRANVREVDPPRLP